MRCEFDMKCILQSNQCWPTICGSTNSFVSSCFWKLCIYPLEGIWVFDVCFTWASTFPYSHNTSNHFYIFHIRNQTAKYFLFHNKKCSYSGAERVLTKLSKKCANSLQMIIGTCMHFGLVTCDRWKNMMENLFLTWLHFMSRRYKETYTTRSSAARAVEEKMKDYFYSSTFPFNRYHSLLIANISYPMIQVYAISTFYSLYKED